MSVSLSTHVLDTGAGAPASGVLVVLYRGDMFLAETRTDDDGRASLGDRLDPGAYRLVFHPPSPFFNDSRVLGDVTYWPSAWLRRKLPGER